jgi:hypothetical protein
MDKENIVFIHNGILLSYGNEWNYVICRKMDRNRWSGDHYVKQNKPDSQR